MKKKAFFWIAFVCLFFAAGCKKSDKELVVSEDHEAKAMLQGVWVNQDDDEVVFSVEGDTIYYPDSTSLPTFFRIFADTLIVKGASESKYRIKRQTAHLFEFVNMNGDVVVLVKSDDQDDQAQAEQYRGEVPKPVALNQRQLIKRDTVVFLGGNRYHCYIQVNPTTYKVYKQSMNDDGVEITNVYYDNTIHVSTFYENRKLYGHDFRKQEFEHLLKQEKIEHFVLSDVLYECVDNEGFHYSALIGIPDELISYSISICISKTGEIKMTLDDN